VKRIFLVLGAGAACIGLGACVDHVYSARQPADFYVNHPVAYDGYYDDFYGAIYDGYWGDEGFYYSKRMGEPFLVDHGNHFRREAGPGFHAFHGGVHKAVGAKAR
jgi:hypothetical protein